MLDETLKAEIREAYQCLLQARGLNPRLGQREMIAEVANALGDPDAPEPIAVVEAGTGTGKTIAYTIAGVPVAKARGKHLVIATATIALQEQLLDRDLPDILKHSGLDFSVQLAKGRARYACLQKLDHGLSGGDQASLIPLYPDEFDTGSADDSVLFQAMVESLGNGGWDGDLDAWPSPLTDQQRRRVTTDAYQCGGRRCPYIGQCSFYQAREGLGETDVIVTNHDLVLADLKLGGGVILPPPEDCLFVFDEGHRLPEKCLGHFVLSVRSGATEQALRDLGKWLTQNESALQEALGSEAIISRLLTGIGDLHQLLADAKLASEACFAEATSSEEYRFPLGVVPDSLADLARQSSDLWQQHLDLANRLSASLERLSAEADAGQREERDAWFTNAQVMVSRAESQLALWRSFASADETPSGPPEWARWLRLGNANQDIEWRASPILAADLLTEHLWSRAAGVVVSSATLSAMGSFDRFITRSGAPTGARYKRVQSPFDPGKVEFVVPAMASDPSDPDAHTEELCRLLPELIATDLGALVLFSSRRQLETVAERLREALPHQLLVQDSMSKAELLAQHRQHVDQRQASVIFGLASFAEGIDLPGDYCQHVVIAKLPFAVPDDPLEAALAERVTAQGGQPFMVISVPDAALKLTQACGRLQRSETDTGRITLLDRRVVDRRYGRAILDSLPRYRFTIAR